jgi:hypothetical protein
LSAANYLLSNHLTGDETPLPKMDIRAFMTKSFEVTKSTNEALLLV